MRRFDEFVAFALEVSDRLGGQLSVAAFLGEVVPLLPTDHPNFLPLADLELQSLQRTGSTAVALARAQAMLAVARSRAEADPASAGAQRPVGAVLDRLGDLMLRLGNGAEAERMYRASLGIRERLAEADPGSADAQRDLGVVLDRLGA